MDCYKKQGKKVKDERGINLYFNIYLTIFPSGSTTQTVDKPFSIYKQRFLSFFELKELYSPLKSIAIS